MRVDTLNLIPVEVYFTIVYVLVAVCLVLPPQEFVSAGLTVQNIFSSWLGSEQLYFVYHHIKRTCFTLVFHSLLPFGYFVAYTIVLKHKWMLNPLTISQWPLFWQYFVLLAIMLPICAIVLIFSWSRKNWDHHPISRQLARYAPVGNNWRSVASSINIEYRRVDKFSTGLPGRRMIVTDSWIMKTSTYFVYIAPQTDVHLTVLKTEQFDISYSQHSEDASTGVQYLTIRVDDINKRHGSFNIRLRSEDYDEVRTLLTSPIRQAQDVIIQQSVSDRFIQAFSDVANDNPRYHRPPDMEVEQCIGCMQKEANVKLVKSCVDGSGPAEEQCSTCYCRPMWCVECMARWFVNRQNKAHPEKWLSCKAPCPTCRTRFCTADVCLVE